MLNTPGRSNWLTRWLIDDRKPLNAGLCDFDRLLTEVQPSDVILVEGRSRVSDIIKILSQSPWSHSVLYIGKLRNIENDGLRNLTAEFVPREHHDTPLILEALFDEGVCLKPLEKYRGEHLRLCRPKDLYPDDTQKIMNYALKHLGNRYSTRHIFDLLRYLLPIRLLPRRWLSSLFDPRYGKLHEEICSTLLASGFSSVNYPVRPIVSLDSNQQYKFVRRNPRLFTPSDFDYSPYFDIIKYPIFGEQNNYRHLKWSQPTIPGDDYNFE
jgi:hypothetical protein